MIIVENSSDTYQFHETINLEVVGDGKAYNNLRANYNKIVFTTRHSLRQFCAVCTRSSWTSHTPPTLLRHGCIHYIYACFPLDAVSSSDWLIVDDGQSVFLRSSLDPESWQPMIVSRKKLYSLVSIMIVSVRTRLVSINIAFLTYIEGERENVIKIPIW